MKKIVCLLITLSCIVGLSACGAEKEMLQMATEAVGEIIETTEIIETVEPTVVETEPIVEEVKEMVVPHYIQQDYFVKYGAYGTVCSHGCGITCMAMALSAIEQEEILPDELALKYGEHNTKGGSAWSLFGAVCGDYDIPCEQMFGPIETVMEALAEGKLVISNQRKPGSIFTRGGHYILLSGLTEDGERIMVLDPNRYNYLSPYLCERFENGFKPIQISQSSAAYWIIG